MLLQPKSWRLLALGTGMIACATQQGKPAESLSTGVQEALAALNLDSLCATACSVVLVDPEVRITPALSVVRPQTAPVEFVLDDGDVSALRKTREVLVRRDSRVSDDRPDTANIMVYRVKNQSPLMGDRLFGIAFWPPHLSVRMLFVALDSAPTGWRVKQSGVYMEP